MLSALLLFSSVLSAEAVRLNFTRTHLSHEARDLIARNPRVSRSLPSRFTRETHLKVERRQSSEDTETASYVNNLYTAPITVGDKEYLVVLDSANTDLWVDNAPDDATDTGVDLTLNYDVVGGHLELEGSISIAPVKFGTYEIAEQAFLDVEDDEGKLFELLGFNGFFGLGLEYSRPSQIEKALEEAGGEHATQGQTVLENIFASSPSLERFIAVDLGRKDDNRDIEGIELSIGEYPEAWAEIQETPAIDLYPDNAESWTVLVEAIRVAEIPLDLKSKVKGVPAGKVLAHLNIGDPETLLPPALIDELYGNIEGAASFTLDGEKRWLVPCLTEDVTQFTISGRSFPVHPLDLSEIWQDRPSELEDYTVCINSFRPLSINEEDFDLNLGSSFLRNVQTVFGFPEKDGSGEPYILMQADTEENKVDTQVRVIRGGQMEKLPEELSPDEAVALLKGGSAKSSARPTNGRNKEAHRTAEGTGASVPTGSSDSAVLIAESSDSTTLNKYMAAILALLSLNILIGLGLVVLGVLNYIKRNGSGRKTGPHVYVPVKAAEAS
ncbi:hypothetical protein CC2G_012306 [Coprinopsis cinerea AmutBmut pab1-1]|nr:hypothetical protein CC2G_012306 [Coprinopsis cinerea AmutBmut pab1-1]